MANAAAESAVGCAASSFGTLFPVAIHHSTSATAAPTSATAIAAMAPMPHAQVAQKPQSACGDAVTAWCGSAVGAAAGSGRISSDTGDPRRACPDWSTEPAPRFTGCPETAPQPRRVHTPINAACDPPSAYTATARPFSGTMTFVECPVMAATNLSAFGSMIGNEP